MIPIRSVAETRKEGKHPQRTCVGRHSSHQIRAMISNKSMYESRPFRMIRVSLQLGVRCLARTRRKARCISQNTLSVAAAISSVPSLQVMNSSVCKNSGTTQLFEPSRRGLADLQRKQSLVVSSTITSDSNQRLCSRSTHAYLFITLIEVSTTFIHHLKQP